MAHEYDVLVLGSGPCGMVAALDLARRGCSVALVERRPQFGEFHAQCNTIAARTMEFFRDLGIADRVRTRGLPDEYPGDVSYTSTFTNGSELARIKLPSRAERAAEKAAMPDTPGYADSSWPSSEENHRCTQYYMEPEMQKAIAETEGIALFYSTEMVSFADSGRMDCHSVEAVCKAVGSDEDFVLKARFFIGCDGGHSIVRDHFGIGLSGDDLVFKSRSSLIKSKDLSERYKQSNPDKRMPWMTFTIGSGEYAVGVVIAIDGEDTWLVHGMLGDKNADHSGYNVDEGYHTLLGIPEGEKLDYEIMKTVDWTARRLVASHFRERNTFIVGDAAHLWVPMAGYGMNAGIADTMDLTWKIAGVLEGWAAPAILNSYDLERKPITEQVSYHAMALAQDYFDKKSGLFKNPDNTFIGGIRTKFLHWAVSKEATDTLIGGFIQQKMGASMLEANIPQFACSGLNFGYYYDQSNILCFDGEHAPGYTLGTFAHSTVPGARFPHFWVSARTVSAYDQIGPMYTFVRFDKSVDLGAVEAAAATIGMPIKVLDLDKPANSPWFDKHGCYLVRPDRHIAWRGNEVTNAAKLLDRVRGANADVTTSVDSLNAEDVEDDVYPMRIQVDEEEEAAD